MKKVILKNSLLHNRNKGILLCDNCHEPICIISDDIKSYKLSYICSCRSLGSATLNDCKNSAFSSTYAVLENDNIVCPCCNKPLFKIFKNNFIKLSFRVTCSCDTLLVGYKKKNEHNPRILEYI